MKLNEAPQVNTINNEYITLMDANGNPLKINKANIADAIRTAMPEATLSQKGLTPATFGTWSKSASELKGKLWRITGSGAYLLIHIHPIHTAVLCVYQSQSDVYPELISDFILKKSSADETLIYKDDRSMYLHGIKQGGTKNIIVALGGSFNVEESNVDISTLTWVF